MSDILSWIWLSTKLPPASPYADLLMESFDHDADAIYKASYEDYEKISDLKSEYAELLSDKSLEEASRILDWCTENNVGLLPYNSKFYPQRLRDIERAPLLLYYKGRLINFDDNVCIALVGTRRMTDYGKREGYRIARDLILGGAVVVSGMARGVDTICHRGALDAGGYTIAVLGCGIDRVYPAENEYIMNEIARSGLVITEYKPFTPPYGSNFPTRNRIISGLSLGTLVVEADAKSGAMITARCAEKQGRDIFSIPGNVGEMNSVGPNRLLKKGAKIVTGALDLLDAPRVGDVAGDHHAVRAVVAEVRERFEERVFVAVSFKMHVAQHSERHIRRAGGRCRTGLFVGCRNRPRRGNRPGEESPSCHVRCHFTFLCLICFVDLASRSSFPF